MNDMTMNDVAGASSEVRVVKLKVHADARGCVFEPLEPELLGGWQNVHAVVTVPGTVRGNHRHLRGSELTTVLGPALVRWRERAGDVREATVPAGEAWRFHIPAGVSHAFTSVGDAPFTLIAFNTERHDPARPDVERDELIA